MRMPPSTSLWDIPHAVSPSRKTIAFANLCQRTLTESQQLEGFNFQFAKAGISRYFYFFLINALGQPWRGLEEGREAAQPLYLCKVLHMQVKQLAQCVYCSAVAGCHSTSTKLLFVYLKTCIPWKKMPQDSTVFLKLNPAGADSKRVCTPVLAPSLSCRRAWQNTSHVLSHEGGNSLESQAQTKCLTQKQRCHHLLQRG